MHPRMIKKRISCEEHAQQASFFMKQNAPQARPINQNAQQARLFDQDLTRTLSY